MLKLLLGLSPQVIMLVFGLGGVLGGGGLALGAAKLWNDWVDNPGIVRTQQAICLTQVERAASEAQLLEERRRYDAGRATAEEFIKQQLEAERRRQTEVKELENEITAYEKRIIAEGRSCGVTADDLEYLGLQHDPAAH